MKFKYQARTKEGELQVGIVDAGSRDAALQVLASHQLYTLTVESAEVSHWYDRINEFLNRVKRKDLVIFARQLATLLEARLPLNNALRTLHEQTANQRLRESIMQMTMDIDAGLSFSQALEHQQTIFPSYYVDMVRAAEVTGNLAEVAGFLADYTEREADLASKAASAMIYPGIVLGLFLVVGFILLTFVFPQIKPVFDQSDVSLPWYTQFFLGAGLALQKWWPAVLIGVLMLGTVLIDYANTPEGVALIDDMKLRLPVLNKVFFPLLMARFGNAAELLIHGGVPMAQALEIISHMMGNVLYEDVVHQVAEDVRQGKVLSESLADYPRYFPLMVPQMVSVGETTGKTEEMFHRLSLIYTREANQVMDNLVDLIQPILMIGMGLMVGFLFASILVPLYQLTASIH
ncbi:MAG: type II secretion system F family protein [Patescibacteria group bacterium]|nr:type II secretion system F family protein [Patescibacteria group bacterium]